MSKGSSSSTMRISRQAMLSMWLLMPAAAIAQAPPRDQTPAPNPVEALAWLVGGIWSAESKLPDGSPATIEATFHWAGHRRALKYSLVRRSGGRVLPSVEGICGWHPARKTLVLWEMDQDGNLTESTLRAEGPKVSYDEVIYGADGSVLPVRAEAVREGDDRFVFKASVEKDGAWPVVFEAVYQRAAGR
jgi:hypothetical protein